MPNIFTEAKWLLDHKNGREMTEDEQHLISTAIIPLMLNPEFEEITIGEGLDILARMVGEESKAKTEGK